MATYYRARQTPTPVPRMASMFTISTWRRSLDALDGVHYWQLLSSAGCTRNKIFALAPPKAAGVSGKVFGGMGTCPVDVQRFIEAYDHMDPDFTADPYPIWDEMREKCPVAHSDKHKGFWIPTRKEDIDRIAHDPKTFSSRKTSVPDPSVVLGDDFELNAPPITSDPPDHTKFRRLLLPAFTPKQIATWEPVTWQIATDLVEGFVGRDEIDAAREFALDVPVIVIARILGVDEGDRDQFDGWLRRIVEHGSADPDDAKRAFGEIFAYFRTRVQEHHEQPQDDLITFLIDARFEGESLDDEDIVGACMLLLAAGIDSTRSTIGSSLHYLATHPEDRRRLVDAMAHPDDSLWPLAVEEFLRAFAPVTMARIVTEDVKLHNQHISRGDMVLLPFAAANRDPKAFERADEVIIDRRDNRHYTFGVGIHRCLGSNLARMELRVALQVFLREFPDFYVKEGAEVRYAVGNTRGPRELPLVIGVQDSEQVPA
jgi:cytochrome P450